MATEPTFKFVNMVDTKADINYSQHGDALVPLDQVQQGPIDISGFQSVSLMIGSCNATSARVYIGKISGPTLAAAYDIPLDSKAHTLDVVGPQMNLWLLGGPANMSEKVKIWVYLKK